MTGTQSDTVVPISQVYVQHITDAAGEQATENLRGPELHCNLQQLEATDAS